MSDTPRTDAVDNKYPSIDVFLPALDLARQLERELNEAVVVLQHAIEAEAPGWFGDDEPSWMTQARAFLSKHEKGKG